MEIERIITPEKHDLGGFSVQRSLPNEWQSMVGPFIFFDHLGPAVFAPGEGVDVRPHPHINLATVTYLFEGSLLHRDSLGMVQEILPGEVNWMTAGKGIVHSERSPDSFRQAEATLHAIQTWVALPESEEERDPDFTHYDATELPQWTETGTAVTLIAGDFAGYHSPVKALSPILYLILKISAGGRFQLPSSSFERAVYTVSPSLAVGETSIEQHRLAILQKEADVVITAEADSLAVVVGGAPVGERQKFWNFVSSRPERIAQAKKDWQTKQFPPVPNEEEFIPLPG